MPQSTNDRILYFLKTRGRQTAQAIGAHLEISSVAARKQLLGLEADGLVAFEDSRESVGRPRRYWQLTDAGHARFPDRHSDLTVDLLTAVRSVFGESGLDALITERESATLAAYARALKTTRSLGSRVRRLAELRCQEGYMAESRRNPDGSFLLIENHCPICAAATQCQGLCRAELQIFRSVLGGDVAVTRVDHILAGARRCAYRVTPK